MAKVTIKENPKAREVTSDLDNFKAFCRGFGYRFNESDLYNNKAYAYQQFCKFQGGKRVKDMWAEDARRLGRVIEGI